MACARDWVTEAAFWSAVRDLLNSLLRPFDDDGRSSSKLGSVRCCVPLWTSCYTMILPHPFVSMSLFFVFANVDRVGTLDVQNFDVAATAETAKEFMNVALGFDETQYGKLSQRFHLIARHLIFCLSGYMLYQVTPRGYLPGNPFGTRHLRAVAWIVPDSFTLMRGSLSEHVRRCCYVPTCA